MGPEPQWRRRREPTTWPGYPLLAWHASDRMADLLDEVDLERLARVNRPRGPAGMAHASRIRFAGASVLAAFARRLMPWLDGSGRIQAATLGHRDIGVDLVVNDGLE